MILPATITETGRAILSHGDKLGQTKQAFIVHQFYD